MKTRSQLCVLFAAWLLAGATIADSLPPRLAICVAGQDARKVGDLLFAGLANAPQVAMVERDMLDQIAAEAALGPPTGDSAIHLGSLLKANGLVFVHTDADFLHVTLMETRHGARLFELLRDRSDIAPEETSRTSGELVLASLPRLAGVSQDAPRLCLLPIEMDDSHASRIGKSVSWEVARIMTGLLSARLVDRSDVEIIDRMRMRELLWESPAGLAATEGQAAEIGVLSGRMTHAGELPVRTYRCVMRFAPLGAKGEEQAEFETTEAELPDCALAIANWAAALAARKWEPDPTARTHEAKMHFENGQARRGRSVREQLSSLEIAHLLDRTNHTYATAYLAELVKQNGHTDSVDEKVRGADVLLMTKLERFSRALDLARELDPDAQAPCLPFPSFMLSVPSRIAPVQRISLLPTRDTRAPRIDEGARATRCLIDLLAADGGFEFVDAKAVRKAMDEEHFPNDRRMYANNPIWKKLVHRLAVNWVVETSIHGEEPNLQVRFLGMGGWPYLTGSCTPMGYPNEEPLLGSLRQVAYVIRHNTGRMGISITPSERAHYVDCRRQAERYYKEYCGWNNGIPDPSRLKILVRVSPAWFDTPQEAIVFLTALLRGRDYDADILEDCLFAKITHWDQDKARTAWEAFKSQVSSVDDHGCPRLGGSSPSQ